MAWDSTRTVNWARLIREWIVYAVVMAGVFLIFLRDNVSAGSVAGLAASFPMYLIFGAVLAKMGYQRKTLSDLRRETPARAPRSSRRSFHNQVEVVPLQRAEQRLVLHSFAQTSAKKDNDAQLSLHHGD
ncbi:MAG: hypothetical protein RL628_676 [Actinomycetota bacterium]